MFYAVTLSSSADSLCPGDGVVFTCVTETNNGRLVWDIDNHIQSYHSETQLNGSAIKDIFTTILYNVIENNSSKIYIISNLLVIVPIQMLLQKCIHCLQR